MASQRTISDLSLSLFTEDICAQMIKIGKHEDAENSATRWMAIPSSKMKAFFRHRKYISDDDVQFEINVANSTQSRFTSRRNISVVT